MLRYIATHLHRRHGLVLLTVALANRAAVPVRLLPEDLALFLGLSEPHGRCRSFW